MEKDSNEVDEYLNNLLEVSSPKAKSLIITFFGDSVFPYGGTIWLGSLIKFMEEFNINSKLTRTSIFRLHKEGWLSSKKFSRESYYSLSELAVDKFIKAHYNIYAYNEQDLSNDWIVLFTHSVNIEKEKNLSKILTKEGFSNPSKFTYMHPHYKMESIQNILVRNDLQNEVLLIKGPMQMPMNKELCKEMVYKHWDLDTVIDRYEEFINKFRHIFSLNTNIQDFTPKQCFILRTLLIHEYRRALLFDPKLGNKLLPIDWIGKSASSLVESIYTLIHVKANEYIKSNYVTLGGNQPNLDKFYNNRFGGFK